MHTFKLRLDDLAVAVGKCGPYDPEQITNKLAEYGRAREKVGQSRDVNGCAMNMAAVEEACRLEAELKALIALPAIEQRLASKRKEKPVPVTLPPKVAK